MNDVAWILIGITLWLYSLWHSYSVGFLRGEDDAWREAGADLNRNLESLKDIRSQAADLQRRADELTMIAAANAADSTGAVH